MNHKTIDSHDTHAQFESTVLLSGSDGKHVRWFLDYGDPRLMSRHSDALWIHRMVPSNSLNHRFIFPFRARRNALRTCQRPKTKSWHSERRPSHVSRRKRFFFLFSSLYFITNEIQFAFKGKTTTKMTKTKVHVAGYGVELEVEHFHWQEWYFFTCFWDKLMVSFRPDRGVPAPDLAAIELLGYFQKIESVSLLFSWKCLR